MKNQNPPNATKIMVIRHGEKPCLIPINVVNDPKAVVFEVPYFGIDIFGRQDQGSLIPRGWQRAGALTVLFDPFNQQPHDPLLATPQYLYAAAPSTDIEQGSRPLETITPLSERLNMVIQSEYPNDDYEAMVDSALQCDGTVLICWHHGHIPKIANYILGHNSAPLMWPPNVFDMVWVFDRDASSKWKLTIVPQNLLAGDQSFDAINPPRA